MKGCRMGGCWVKGYRMEVWKDAYMKRWMEGCKMGSVESCRLEGRRTEVWKIEVCTMKGCGWGCGGGGS